MDTIIRGTNCGFNYLIEPNEKRNKVIVFGGGPSLKNTDWGGLLIRKKDWILVAVNRAVEFLKEPDYWFSIDQRYWKYSIPQFYKYKVKKVSTIPLSTNEPLMALDFILPRDWFQVDQWPNSGVAAVIFALRILHAKRILLFGFDMGAEQWEEKDADML